MIPCLSNKYLKMKTSIVIAELSNNTIFIVSDNNILVVKVFCQPDSVDVDHMLIES